MTPILKRRIRRLIHPVSNLKRPHLPQFQSLRISWVLVGLYFVCIITLMFGPPFRLRQFTCQTNTDEPCPDFIIPELKKKQGELAYLAQTDTVIQAFRHSLPQSDLITIEPQWPNKLTASITWQPGIANLQIPASSSALLISKEGRLITLLPSPDQTLPTIIASSAADLIISDQLSDPSLQAALSIIKELEIRSIPLTEIDVLSPIDIRVVLKNNKIGVFTSLKLIDLQVNTLHLILSDPTMNPNLPIIDVRYDRPALKPALPS